MAEFHERIMKVDCYGELRDDSNFEVVCENENDDTVWCIGNPHTNKPFDDWDMVVTVLSQYFNSKIHEISAV